MNNKQPSRKLKSAKSFFTGIGSFLESKRETISILVILFIGFIAYFPYLLNLGFYFNDWHLLLVKMSGVNLVDFFMSDRPGVGVYYGLIQNIIGSAPLGWHLYILVLRLLGGVIAYFLLREVWPQRNFMNTSMAILLVIFPGFLEEPMALTIQTHVLVFDLTLLSIFFSVKAIKSPVRPKFYLFTFLALASELIYLFLYEYFIAMEIVRLIVLGYFIFHGENKEKSKRRILKLLKQWWPYLIVVLGFVFWRVFIFHGGRETTDVGSVVQNYLSQPLHQIGVFVLELWKGFIDTLISSWVVPLYNLQGALRYKEWATNIALTSIGIIIFLGYSLLFIKGKDDEASKLNKREAISIIIIGVVVELACLFPIVLTGRQVRFGSRYDRYTMPALIGAIMILFGFIESISSKIFKISIITFLIGISALTQICNGTFYKNVWDIEKEYWWQLYWRAPGLKEGTVLLFAPHGSFANAEGEEIYVPANLIYYPNQYGIHVVAEVLNNSTVREIVMGRSDSVSYRNITFNRDFKKSLLLSLESEDSCVHIYDSKQIELGSNSSPLIILAASYSNVDQISVETSIPAPKEAFFGTEPPHTWCYYYQKASLARQEKDWIQVVKLADEANAKGLHPNDPSEWMPFLEGYANLGRQQDFSNTLTSMMSFSFVRFQICKEMKSHPEGVYSTGQAYQMVLNGMCGQ